MKMMKISSINNLKKKQKMLNKHHKKRQERKKLEYLNLTHQEYSMRETNTFFWHLLQKKLYNSVST